MVKAKDIRSIKNNITKNKADELNKEHISMTFNELDLVLCKSDTKRKLVKPIYVKTSLYSVGFLYYAGYVLRDASNNKKYYSEEEVREKITNKLEKISIATNEGIVIKKNRLL